MKRLLAGVAALVWLSGCAPTKSQLVTLSSNKVTATPGKGFVYETDTLRLSYQFFSEGGNLHLTLENKLNKPLYIDWKRSSFIIGQNKFDYWFDDATVNLYGQAYTTAYTRYSRSSSLTIDGRIRKENAVDYIPPGAKIEKTQFVIVPGHSLPLPGQYTIQKVAPTDTLTTKPVDVHTYQYTASDSPLTFRNYLTLATDKDFSRDIVLDHTFWASGVLVMPKNQLTGNAFTPYDGYSPAVLRSFPYYRPDSFFISYRPDAPPLPVASQ